MFERFSFVDGKMVSDPNGDYMFYSAHKLLAEAGEQPTTEQSMQLCDDCGKSEAEICVCEKCLIERLHMGV